MILTDEEILNAVPFIGSPTLVHRIARAIEAKIEEKLKQQEPVAWICEGKLYEVQQWSLFRGGPIPNQTPLYAVPMPADVLDADWLSNGIRAVNGENKLGAGALAEKIVEAIRALKGEGK